MGPVLPPSREPEKDRLSQAERKGVVGSVLRDFGAGLLVTLGGLLVFAGVVIALVFLVTMSDESSKPAYAFIGLVLALVGFGVIGRALRAKGVTSSVKLQRCLIAVGCIVSFTGVDLAISEARKGDGPPGNPVPPMLLALLGVGIVVCGIWTAQRRAARSRRLLRAMQ